MGRKSEFGKSRDDWPFSADDVICKPDRLLGKIFRNENALNQRRIINTVLSALLRCQRCPDYLSRKLSCFYRSDGESKYVMIALDLALTSTGHGHPGREVDRLFSPCICVRSSERRAAYELQALGLAGARLGTSDLSSHRAACRE